MEMYTSDFGCDCWSSLNNVNDWKLKWLHTDPTSTTNQIERRSVYASSQLYILPNKGPFCQFNLGLTVMEKGRVEETEEKKGWGY